VKKLKKFRLLEELSQVNFAKKIGVSISLYEKVERGDMLASRNFMSKIKNEYPEINIDEIFFN
jgi:transcriptional regulator with XRE-family HTH domain